MLPYMRGNYLRWKILFHRFHVRIDYSVRTEAGAELVLDAARGGVGIVDGRRARHAEMHFNGAIAANAARAQVVRVGSAGFFEDRVDNKVFLFFGQRLFEQFLHTGYK